MLVHRFQADDEARCLLDSELLAQIGGHAIHSRLRLLARDAVLQTPDGSPLHVVAVGVIVGETAREPDVRPRLNVGVGRKQQFEAGLQHAHDLRAALPADRARHGMPDRRTGACAAGAPEAGAAGCGCPSPSLKSRPTAIAPPII